MFFATYPYLLAATGFSLLWLVTFFAIPKTYWKEMLQVSLVTMILGHFVEQMHFVDWWHPRFIVNAPITIEDTLFGFSAGGSMYALYILWKDNFQIKQHFLFTLRQKITLASLSLFSLFGLFYLFHFRSFWSSLISLFIPVLAVGVYERRLLLPTFLTGISVTVIAFLGYLLTIYLDPGFVSQTYILSDLSGILVLGIPIEELFWFFFAGMGIAAFSVISNSD